MTRRPTLASQVAWARGQAVQHRRIAARAPDGSPSRRAALERAAVADAAAATLSAMSALRRAVTQEA